jgi:hypothetical protein
MKKLPPIDPSNVTPFPKHLQKSTPSSNDASRAQKMKQGIATAEKLLTSYPDYGKSTKEYIAAICEAIAELPDDIITAMIDMKTGIRARCAFLPTIADIMKFAEEYTKRRDQFKSPPSQYKLLNSSAERDPTPDERQRCKEHWLNVKEEIYAKHRQQHRKFEPVIIPEGLSDQQSAEYVYVALANRLGTVWPSRELIELVQRQNAEREERP